MLHSVTLRRCCLAAGGALLACNAAALTLGSPRGAVVLGRPLALAVPLTLDAPGAETCAAAELFHGDQRVADPSVRWDGRGTEGLLRVSSPLPVDEPSITLGLRVGCGAQQTARRYVLLADLPGRDEAAPAPPVVTAPAVRPARPAAAADSPARSAAPAQAPSRKSAAPAPRPPAVVRAPVAAPAVAPRARPRLELEPLDLAAEWPPSLRLEFQLATQPSADPAVRDAAAAWWQALQKTPEQALEEAARVQALQRDLQGLRARTQRNADAMAALRADAERTRDERDTATMLLAILGALLAGVLGWLAWKWQRAAGAAGGARWFEPAPGKGANAPATGEPRATPAPVTGREPGSEQEPQRPAAVRPVAAPVAARPGGEAFAASRGALRMVGVDEVIDVHEKAAFFLSIGEVEQAIAVLESHVGDEVDTSALAWLDLLDLYHSLGRRADYDRLRRTYRDRFAAQVPDFDHFGERTAGLDEHTRAMSRIEALWPSPRVLDVIEESIFRRPGLSGAEPFGLEAYRDLVLLYHLAREVVPQAQEEDARRSVFADSTPAHFDPAQRAAPLDAPARFSGTTLQPLEGQASPESQPPTVDLLLQPPASAAVGVDIDITQPEPDQAPSLDFDISGFELEPIPRRDAGR